MPKLSQIVATEKPTKQRVEKFLTEVNKVVQKGDLFNGFQRVYQPLRDDGERFPPENKHVQQNVATLIPQIVANMADLWNVSATRDVANCSAKADVVVDGQVLMKDAPATFLLFLEKQLNDLHTLVGNFPVLDPAEAWTFDDNASMYKSGTRETAKTRKVPMVITLAPPTKEHPAQTQLLMDDATIGYWHTVGVSGAIPLPKKTRLLEKIEKLQKAVKYAREEANTSPAKEINVAEMILSWVTA